MYYATYNPQQCANTVTVLVFDTAANRDSFVAGSDTGIAIPRSRATAEATNWSLTQNRDIKPRPFTEEYWGIIKYGIDDDLPGFIGELEVCGEHTGEQQRFYS